jgi:hypothetical protein
LAALLATSGFSRYAAQPRTVIRVSPSTVEAKVGQELTVDVEVMQVSGLYGVELHIRFDPAVLEVVDADANQLGVQIEPGSFPSPDFVVRNAADNQGGTIDYAATQLQPSQPSEGGGTVARITFLAKQAATSKIRFDQSLLADHKGSSIQAVPQSGEIKVLGSPTRVFAIAVGIALLVLVGGGIGFIITRRK